MKTIMDYLKLHSDTKATDCAFTYIKDDGFEVHISFQDLHKSAISISRYLASIVQKGEPVVLLFPQGLEYIQAFLGCLYAGVIAVPLYPPKNSQSSDRVYNVVKNCKATIGLSSGELKLDLQELLNPLKIVTLENFMTDDNAAFELHQDIAFLQYTSGSTGSPKGVMVSHDNVLANVKALQRAGNCSSNDVFCNWTPLFHDMGLVCTLLLPIYLGCRSILMSPAHFVRRPFAWLEAISSNKASICGAPNFAYDHCVNRVSIDRVKNIDLSSWRIAFNSAEPVDYLTMRNFTNLFSLSGFRSTAFYPCYGMAEATLFISGGTQSDPFIYTCFDQDSIQLGMVKRSNSDNCLTLVSCGNTQLDHTIKIVDPTLSFEVPEGRVGEIWFNGPSAAQGYWNDHSQTKETFNAKIEGDSRHFLRTGDLGFVYEGNLYISGRLKDLMIVKGKNYYPQDIEKIVQKSFSENSQAVVAAFEVDGEIIIINEIDKKYQMQFDCMKAKNMIQSAIFEHLELIVEKVLFVKSRALYKTSSGKLQRSLIKKKYLSRELEYIFRESECGRTANKNYISPKSDLEFELCKIIQTLLEITTVSVNDNIFDMGLDSLLIIQLISDIQKIGYDIVTENLLMFPTVAELSKFLEGIDKAESHVYCYSAGDTIHSIPNRQLLFKSVFKHHWNMSTIINIEAVNTKYLEQALKDVIQEHAGLRHVFYVQDGIVREKILEQSNSDALELIDLSKIEDRSARSLRIEELANQFQSTLNLSRSLTRFFLFDCGKNEPAKLLLIVHHSLMDGYSVNVFFEEVFNRYLSAVEDICFKPLPRSNTIAEWGYYFYNYINSPDSKKDFDYWSSRPWKDIGLLMDYPEGVDDNVSGDISRYGRYFALHRDLCPIESEYLLNRLPKNISISDVIFTAFANVISSLTENPLVRIEMTVSGRDKIVKGVNIDRTIGWFNDYIPVILEVDVNKPIDEQIASYKRQYNAIPSAGLGFNGLKYLSDDSFVRDTFKSFPLGEFNINYVPPAIGRLKEAKFASFSSASISLAAESPGQLESGEEVDIFWPSYIQVHMDNGSFRIMWGTRDNIYKYETVARALDLWIKEIALILKFYR